MVFLFGKGYPALGPGAVLWPLSGGLFMKTSLKLLLAAGALCTAGFIGTVPAAAQSHMGFSFRDGDVAFGYQDGYYDRYHHWRYWRNQRERDWYRVNYRHRWHGYRHDRDRYDRDRDNDGVPNWAD